jgi:hypothetical protein
LIIWFPDKPGGVTLFRIKPESLFRQVFPGHHVAFA